MPRDVGIADRLRRFGLVVVEVNGWRTRGSTTFSPRGSVDHHTADGPGNAPSLNICVNGRSDLPGPLCNVLVGRDNTCYVIAAGRANHAGSGGWRGLSGNSSVYGVERENRGTAADPWRPDQTDTAAKIHAALISGLATPDPGLVCGHKEWAPGRKVDAHAVDYAAFRRAVARHLAGPAPAPPPEEDDMLFVQVPGNAAGDPTYLIAGGKAVKVADNDFFTFCVKKFGNPQAMSAAQLAEFQK